MNPGTVLKILREAKHQKFRTSNSNFKSRSPYHIQNSTSVDTLNCSYTKQQKCRYLELLLLGPHEMVEEIVEHRSNTLHQSAVAEQRRELRENN